MSPRKVVAVLAGLWATYSHSAAAATCDAASLFSFSYSDQAAATLSYGSTYNYTATNGAGTTRPFSVQITQNGMSSTQAGGVQMPAISTLVTGPDATKRNLVVGGTFTGRTSSMAGTTRVAIVTFNFATPIHSFSITAHDVDFANNQFRDWVQVSGSNGTTTYTPVLTTPWGTGNTGSSPSTNANSSVTVGPTSTPLNLTSSQLGGNATSGNNSNAGTFTASFAQPVTSVTFKYGNYPLTGTETSTGQQAIGIAGISFCPMPVISLAKTSAPATGALGAFNIPDNDIIYTITVTNSGASSTDTTSIVISDVLQANTTFRNQAFDGTTSLPVKLNGPAGISLDAANVTYRKAGTSTFNYIPTSGYDPQIVELRIVPTGELGADSSFSVQFRAKVN